MHKKYKAKFIAAIGVAILVVAVFIAAKYQNVCNFMVDKVYRVYAKFVSKVTALINFSLFEILALLAVVFVIICIILIFKNIKKDKLKSLNVFSTLLIVVLTLVFYYSFLTAFLYNREALPVEKEDTLLSNDTAKNYALIYLNELNNLANLNETDSSGKTICTHENDLEEEIKKEFFKLENPYYIDTTINAKKMNFSFLMSAFSISGITFIPTIEPCYNSLAPYISQCFSIAHEIAHTKAVMKEYEADMLALYVLMNADSVYLRYVGYLNALSYVRDILVLTNSYEEYKNFEFASNIYLDLEYEYSWWSQKNKLEKIGNFFNNIYLKSNSQNGVASYRSYANYTTYFDEELNKKIYVVNSYSVTQNMIFSIIKQNLI